MTTKRRTGHMRLRNRQSEGLDYGWTRCVLRGERGRAGNSMRADSRTARALPECAGSGVLLAEETLVAQLYEQKRNQTGNAWGRSRGATSTRRSSPLWPGASGRTATTPRPASGSTAPSRHRHHHHPGLLHGVTRTSTSSVQVGGVLRLRAAAGDRG